MVTIVPDRHVVELDYVNWRGHRRKRFVAPTGFIRYGTTPFHPEPGWLFEAFDPEDGKTKEFACRGIHGWREVEGEGLK